MLLEHFHGKRVLLCYVSMLVVSVYLIARVNLYTFTIHLLFVVVTL